MKRNTLKKLLVIGIGTMTLLGSNISVSAEHVCSGGKAYCKFPAICDYCGQFYGDIDETSHQAYHSYDPESPTCTEDGHSMYQKCDDCGKIINPDYTVYPKGHIDENKDHICDRENCRAILSYCSGGTATCMTKAVCDYCGKPYGDINSNYHVGGTEIRNAKTATCSEAGYTGDTYCLGCETIIEPGTRIPVDPDNHDDSNKDHFCDREKICGLRISYCSGGTATCIEKAVCDYCGKPYGELDGSNHVGGTHIRNTKDATCTEEGYTGDTYCLGCETIIEPGTRIPVDPDNHGLPEMLVTGPTCTEGEIGYEVCPECGKIGSCAGSFGTNIKGHNDTDSDHYCDNVNRFYHDTIYQYEDVICREKISDCKGGTATCTEQAICTICNKPYGDVDKSNHVGDTEIRDAKPATCEEDGYTGDTYCKDCNAKIMDGEPIAKLNHIDENKDHVCDREDCKSKLSDHTGGTATCKDLAICEYCNNAYGELDSANHVGDTEIRDAKPATCTEDGYTGDTYCTSCNTKLLDGTIIPATGHIDSDNNNECDACNIIINETEAETEPITEKEKPAKKKETEKQTESIKPVVEETESNNNLPEAPKTGDNTPIVVMVSLFLGSIAIIFACITCRGRKED